MLLVFQCVLSENWIKCKISVLNDKRVNEVTDIDSNMYIWKFESLS